MQTAGPPKRCAMICLVLLVLLPAWPTQAASHDSLNSLLGQLGQDVERFWREFAAVSCTEIVEQSKLGPTGKILNEKRAVYDYIVLMQLIGTDLAVEESRVLQEEVLPKKKKRPQHRSLLVTNGFAIMMLVFHPHFQSSYVFTLRPDHDIQGEERLRIDFEHVNGARSPSALELNGRIISLEWQGTAWLDPRTNAIMRMKTGLKEAVDETGLASLDSVVEYGEVTFADGDQSLWLPQVASIEARTEHQHWRNVHRFSDYRRFSVDTTVRIGDPDQ